MQSREKVAPNLTVSRSRKNADGVTPASREIATVLVPCLGSFSQRLLDADRLLV